MYILKEQLKNTSATITRHLSMDEIKLKDGIMWNCMNNELTGFVQEDFKKSVVRNIMGLYKKRKTMKSNYQYILNNGVSGQQEVIPTTVISFQYRIIRFRRDNTTIY